MQNLPKRKYKHMKRILDFKGFVNESRVNEGGGAGVNFTIDEVSLKAEYILTKDDVKVNKVEVSLSDTFKAEGYDDGMSDVGTWLLTVDDSAAKGVTRKDLANLPLSTWGDFMDVLENTIGLNMDADEFNAIEEDEAKKKYKIVDDLFDAYPDLEIEFSVSMTYKEFEDSLFSGWIRGDVKVGDVVIAGNKYDTGDYDEFLIAGVEMNQREQEIGEFLEGLTPKLKAGKRFPEFWNTVFKNEYEKYKEYVEYELEYRVTEDEFDDEIEAYLESNEVDFAGVTLDDFKKDYKEKYSEDFLQYWMDEKYEYFWNDYYESVMDTYAPGNNPDEE